MLLLVCVGYVFLLLTRVHEQPCSGKVSAVRNQYIVLPDSQDGYSIVLNFIPHLAQILCHVHGHHVPFNDLRLPSELELNKFALIVVDDLQPTGRSK